MSRRPDHTAPPLMAQGRVAGARVGAFENSPPSLSTERVSRAYLRLRTSLLFPLFPLFSLFFPFFPPTQRNRFRWMGESGGDPEQLTEVFAIFN